MIRIAVGRVRRCVPQLAAIILTTSVAVGVIAMPAQALGLQPATGSSGDQQQRVNQIIAELDKIGYQIDALDETYAEAVNQQEDLQIEIDATSLPNFKGLFPLNRARWFRCHIVNNAVYALYFVDYS